MTDAPDVPDSAGAHGGLKSALGRKLGPLPMGIWVLAVGGGLVFAYYMRRNSSSTDATATDTTGADTGDTGQGTWPYGLPNGVGQAGYDPSGSDSGSTDDGTLPTTNEQWQKRAVQVLVGLGYEAIAVDRAVSAYLGGESLTTIQRAIINEAILRIGPPPVSPPSPTSPDQPPPIITPPKTGGGGTIPPTPTWPPKKPVVHKPTTTPKPTGNAYPKRWKTVVNGRNSNYSALASKYHLGISGTELYNYQLSSQAGRSAATKATLKKRGPNLIFAAGTTVLPYPKK